MSNELNQAIAPCTEAIKYAGAGWMLARQKPPATSALGVKVMNVLGQVYQGIYHIDDYVLKPTVRWDGVFAVSVTVYGCLSTYDFEHLTLLVLCCQRAELAVGIYGSFKGYTKMFFTPNPGGSEMMSPLFLDASSSLEMRLTHCTHIKKKLEDISGGAIWTTEGLAWHHVLTMTAIAHRLCTRFQVRGRSPQSLAVMVTQRTPGGGVSHGHPTWHEAKTRLRPYWDIDYTSKD